MFRTKERKKKNTRKSILDSSKYFNTSWACPEVVYFQFIVEDVNAVSMVLRSPSSKNRRLFFL
tara:strand:+ start:7122 stop:7310 length:189 start_codon:yes stop_codon:yes gene_type:complete